MKYIVLTLVLLMTLTGCFNKSINRPGESVEETSDSSENIEWYVIKKAGQRALVVNPAPQDFGSGGNREFYDAVWISNFPKTTQVGQKVKITFKGEMLTSYPGQAEAKKVSVLPGIKPNTAKLTEEQVLREAIESKEAADIGVFVPTSISFDEKSQSWTIQFKDGASSSNTQKERQIQIPDQSFGEPSSSSQSSVLLAGSLKLSSM